MVLLTEEVCEECGSENVDHGGCLDCFTRAAAEHALESVEANEKSDLKRDSEQGGSTGSE